MTVNIASIITIICFTIWFRYGIGQVEKFVVSREFIIGYDTYNTKEKFWIFLTCFILFLLGPLTLKFDDYL